MKIGKNSSDLGSRVPGSWQDIGHFSGNFGYVKYRIQSDVKGEYKRHKLEQKSMTYPPYFGQDLDSKKKVVENWNSGTCLVISLSFFGSLHSQK